MPGATAFRRIPAPVHVDDTAFRRTHRASASLVAGYAAIEPASSASRRARSSSPSRQAATRSMGTPGWMVVELELIATAAGLTPCPSSGRNPSKISTVPK